MQNYRLLLKQKNEYLGNFFEGIMGTFLKVEIIFIFSQMITCEGNWRADHESLSELGSGIQYHDLTSSHQHTIICSGIQTISKNSANNNFLSLIIFCSSNTFIGLNQNKDLIFWIKKRKLKKLKFN